MRKYKYEVAVTTINIDGDGNHKTESFDIPFTDGDLPTMRREAYNRANDLTMMFDNEMPEGHEFDSGNEAKLKGYRNVKGYSICIIFFIDEEGYMIEGEYELQAEAMEVEKMEFIENGFEYPFEIPEYDDDDTNDVNGNDFSHSQIVNSTITKTKEYYQIDYAVGYDFNGMKEMIKGSAKGMGVSVKKYLKDGKKAFRNLGRVILNKIAESNDPIHIGEMIEELNDARCKWTLYDRYDFERKLKKGKL